MHVRGNGRWGNIMIIPYFSNGNWIVIEGDSVDELLKHIEKLTEDGTVIMKDCHVEGETLCLD